MLRVTPQTEAFAFGVQNLKGFLLLFSFLNKALPCVIRQGYSYYVKTMEFCY